MLGDTPLDMLQYYLLFGVHRFPESPKDRLTYNTDSKHIVVAHNNNFFKVLLLPQLNNSFNLTIVTKKSKLFIKTYGQYDLSTRLFVDVYETLSFNIQADYKTRSFFPNSTHFQSNNIVK